MDLRHTSLNGPHLTLKPVDEALREGLRAISQDEDIWRYMPISGMGDGFDQWFDKNQKAQDAAQVIRYAVTDNATGALMGHTTFLNIDRVNHGLEIGNTWYAKDHWGAHVNPEAKFLMLREAFEGFGAARVELRCDSRNKRSAAAIQKLGAHHDGTLPSHMFTQGDFRRDTMVFSILQKEWPAVKAGLEKRFAD